MVNFQAHFTYMRTHLPWWQRVTKSKAKYNFQIITFFFISKQHKSDLFPVEKVQPCNMASIRKLQFLLSVPFINHALDLISRIG